MMGLKGPRRGEFLLLSSDIVTSSHFYIYHIKNIKLRVEPGSILNLSVLDTTAEYTQPVEVELNCKTINDNVIWIVNLVACVFP